MKLEVIVLTLFIIMVSLSILWFIKFKPVKNKKLKKLLEKFECCA